MSLLCPQVLLPGPPGGAVPQPGAGGEAAGQTPGGDAQEHPEPEQSPGGVGGPGEAPPLPAAPSSAWDGPLRGPHAALHQRPGPPPSRLWAGGGGGLGHVLPSAAPGGQRPAEAAPPRGPPLRPLHPGRADSAAAGVERRRHGHNLHD